jgi:hypothetical protein
LNALNDKLEKTKTKLCETRQNNPNAIKKIKRLEMKIQNLTLISQLTNQTKKKTESPDTKSELTIKTTETQIERKKETNLEEKVRVLEEKMELLIKEVKRLEKEKQNNMSEFVAKIEILPKK